MGSVTTEIIPGGAVVSMDQEQLARHNWAAAHPAIIDQFMAGTHVVVPKQISTTMRNEILLAWIDKRLPQEMWDRVLNAVKWDQRDASPRPVTQPAKEEG